MFNNFHLRPQAPAEPARPLNGLDAERAYATIIMSSVRLSISVRDVQVPWSHRLEYFENNFTAISRTLMLGLTLT